MYWGMDWQSSAEGSAAIIDDCAARSPAVPALRRLAGVLSSTAPAASRLDSKHAVLNAKGSAVAVVLGERLARYGFGGGHPFGPDRLGAFLREFEQRGLDQQVTVLEPRLATVEE